MTEYKIVIEETAENDLVGILSYISDTLHEPNIAFKIYGSIKKEILTLNKMPFRYVVVNEVPYRSMGVRRIPVMLLTKWEKQYIFSEYSITVENGSIYCN